MTVITPAADSVMARTGAAQSGSAAALTQSVIQVGGAIGIGVITTIFITAAQASFFEQMQSLGIPVAQGQAYLQALTEAVRETTLSEIPRLPEVSTDMHASLLDAFRHAVAAGINRSFVLSAAVALFSIPVVLLGIPGRRARKVNAPVQR
jgi:hypothetical protein